MVDAVWDARVPGFLGRVLDVDGTPVGTCFQVSPGVLVTAAHVLAEAGCDWLGASLSVDALNGSVGRAPAQVVAVDVPRDLAVVRRAEPLAESVPVSLHPVAFQADVVVTGVAEVDDPGHGYQSLDAPGSWQGGTMRDDQVMLWRVRSADVMPGMSGAPVLRLADGAAVGVVSARYNSADGWLRDSVWVARVEDVAVLLSTVPGIDVRRRLVFADEVGTVLSVRTVDTALVRGRAGAVATRVAPDPGPARDRGVPEGVGGLNEAAVEAARALMALDDAYRGVGGAGDAAEWLLSRAVAHGRHEGDAVRDFRRRTRLRGLDPRVLLLSHPQHEEALRHWSAPLDGSRTRNDPYGTGPNGTGPNGTGSNGAAPRTSDALLDSFRHVLVEELSEELFVELSAVCRRQLRAVLTDGRTLHLEAFLTALTARLPELRTASTRAVMVRRPDPNGNGAQGQQGGTSGAAPGAAEVQRRARRAVAAAQMCRIPDPDPFVLGRTELVADVVRAVRGSTAWQGTATAFLSGQPGVGTSTVAIEAARALAPDFPGGVFHVDLHGLVPDARRPARTVVRMVAEALGLDIGADLDAGEHLGDAALFARFTAELQGRGVLLVLDDALDAAHVAPLVKPPATCAVVVTSRDRVQGYADRSLVFRVEPLTRDAAVRVLAACDPERSHDPALLHRLARLCADVPLALRMVGGRLASRPDLPVDYLLHLLEEESTRLDYLDSGDRAVRAAIRLSYDNLDAAARRTFRLIAAVPGAVTTGEELGACLDAPALRQELLLNRLVDRSLAQHAAFVRTFSGGVLASFALFDLVLLFAKERLAQEEPEEDVHDVTYRSVQFLRDRLGQINRGEPDAELSGALDPARFHAAVRTAEERGWLALALELAEGVAALYQAGGELDGEVAANDVRVHLHQRLSAPADAVRLCWDNAELLRDTDPARALVYAQRARDIAGAHNLHAGAAEADFLISLMQWDQGDAAAALASGRRAVSVLTALGLAATAVPIAINNSKLAFETAGPEEARALALRAHELAEGHGTAELRASALFQRQRAELWAGNHAEALPLAWRVETAYTTLGNWWTAAVACENGACAAEALDDHHAVKDLVAQAVEHWQRCNTPPHLVSALIDLSAAHIRLDEMARGAEALTRAVAALDLDDGANVSAALSSELLLRYAAVYALFDAIPPSAGLDHALRSAAESAVHDGDPDPDVERLRTDLRCFLTTGTGRGKATKAARDLLSTGTRHPPADEVRLHETLGTESAPRPALGTA
ncbi:trypsin-like peptidase domain-containing protein [Streptomyces sp. NPDC088194]|uniref:trypsin-like peptidase domain-containing protein n=1 Tax=Streptomyces sp. NPDC088194 TaxID=3154931 RepID=UPI0034509CF0